MAANSSPFAAMTAMGALIAPAQLARIAAAELKDQTAADYGVPKGLTLRDELARYFRIGQAQWRAFDSASAPGIDATARFIETLLKDILGFDDIARRHALMEVGGRTFPIALIAGNIPIAIAPAADPIDRASDALSAPGRRRSAATLVQEYLNAEPAALWGLASNGRCVRLVRDNPSLTRPAFIEFDLSAIFDDEAYADFAALFLLLHRSRFSANDTSCALELWRNDGAKAGTVARDKLRGGVEAALELLGQGFLEHPANSDLADRLRSGALPLPDYYAALLRLVYRLIFLLAAEDRNLLHPAKATAAARQLYARGYAVGRLRDRAVRRAAWDRHHDAWEGLCVVMDALGRGEPRLAMPALGGLFDRDSLTGLDNAKLSNAKLLEAIYRLAWLREASGPVPVNWRDMESEELGSVYEGLLELVPRLERGGAVFTFATEAAETKGNARKVSGSYYTPDSLVQALLDSALTPLLDATEAGAEDPVAALLALRVVDPACGSGHFLLAAARRIAARVAAARTGGAPSPDDYRHALRDVMGACIHGVDRNPMAVELTKVALWIESVEPGKPLGLLDTNIRCGDALLGLDDLGVLEKGIPDAAYAPLAGDDKATARGLLLLNRAERDRPLLSAAIRPARLAREAAKVAAMPTDTLAEVEAKRKSHVGLFNSPEGWSLRRAADAWVAAFLAPKPAIATSIEKSLVPTTRHVWESLGGRPPQGPIAAEVDRLAYTARVFHWPLEFPAVLAGENPGFDLVVGNPPWEVMQLGEEEYFAQRLPEIAELPGAARKRAIAALETEAPLAFAQYQMAKRIFDVSNVFARGSGRFDLTARGKVNTYGLFAESFSRLAGQRGRAGVIVPTGIATDATTAPYFAHLIEKRRLASLFDFENRDRIFPGIDSRIKFSLLTIASDCDTASFAFFLTSTDQLPEAERRFTLTPAQIAAINPNTKTAPVFRARADSELTAQIYGRVPILIDENKGPAGNPWGVEFRQGLFNMTSDSGMFRTAAELAAAGYDRDGSDWRPSEGLVSRHGALALTGGRDATTLSLDDVLLTTPAAPDGTYVPLYEAKMIHQFDHRWATYDSGAGGGDDEGSRDATLIEKADANFEATPRYWVPAADVSARLAAKGWKREWLMGWRDITNATNERTVISSAFPLAGCGDTLLLMMPKVDDLQLCACLIANLCSTALDYTCRQKIGGTHLKYNIFKQLAVLPPSTYTAADLAFIVPRVLELTYTSHAMAPFARDLGFTGPPFGWDDARRAQLRAELDAWYARAYGLTRDQLRYILDPADVMGPDYPSETFRVLKKNDIAKHGDYRTARLTLAAWDAQAANLS